MTIRKLTTLTSGLVTLAELRTGQTFIAKSTVQSSKLRAQDISGALIPKASIVDQRIVQAARLVDPRDNIVKILREILGVQDLLGLSLSKPIIDVIEFADVIELIKRRAPERSFDDQLFLDDVIALLIAANRTFTDAVVMDQQISLLVDRHLDTDFSTADQLTLNNELVKTSELPLTDALRFDVLTRLQHQQITVSQISLEPGKFLNSDFGFSDAAQTLAGITRASELSLVDVQSLSAAQRLRDNTNFISQLVQNVSKATADLQLVTSRPSLQPGPGIADDFSLTSDPISWFMDKVLADEQPVPDFIGVFDGLNYSFAFAVADRPVMLDVFSRSFNRQFAVELDVATLDLVAKLLSKPVMLAVNVADASVLRPGLGINDAVIESDSEIRDITKLVRSNLNYVSQLNYAAAKPLTDALLTRQDLSKQLFKTATSVYTVNDVLIYTPGKQFNHSVVIDQTEFRNIELGKFSLIAELDAVLLDVSKSLDEFIYTVGDVTPFLPAYNTYARNSIPVASRFGVSIDNNNVFEANNQSAGRFVFTGQLSPRVLTLAPLTNVTENTLEITLIAGTVGAVNGLEQPDVGEDLVLQYSTDGTTWMTSTTLWTGGTDWIGTVGLAGTYTTSVTFTAGSPVNLSWRFIQTNFSNPGFDQYAIVNISSPRSGAVNSMFLQDWVLITDILTGPVEPRVYMLDQDSWYLDKAAADQTLMLDLLQFYYNYDFLGDDNAVFMLDEPLDYSMDKDLRTSFGTQSALAWFMDKVLASDQPMLDLVGIFDGLNYASVINKIDDTVFTDEFSRAWTAFTRFEDSQTTDSRITNFDATIAGYPFQDFQSFESVIFLFKAVFRDLASDFLVNDAYRDTISFIRQFPLYSLNSVFGTDNSNILVGTAQSGFRSSGDPQENFSYILNTRAYQSTSTLVQGWGTSIATGARSTDVTVMGDPTAVSPRIVHPTTVQSRRSGTELENISWFYDKSAKQSISRVLSGWGTSITTNTSSTDWVVVGDPSVGASPSRRGGSALERVRYDVNKALATVATEYHTNLIWDVALPRTEVAYATGATTQYSTNWFNNRQDRTPVFDATTADTVAHRLAVPIYWNSSQTATITAAGSMGLRSLTTGSLTTTLGPGYYGPFDLGFDFNLNGAKYRHVIVSTDGKLIFNSSLTSVVLLGAIGTGVPYINLISITSGSGLDYYTTIGLLNGVGATVTSNINIYDANNPANLVQPGVYTTAGTTTATGAMGSSRIFRVQYRTYASSYYQNNVGQLRVVDGGSGTSNFLGIIAELRIYQQVAAPAAQVLEFIADYDYNLNDGTNGGLLVTPEIQTASLETAARTPNNYVRDEGGGVGFLHASALAWSDARGNFIYNEVLHLPYVSEVVMGGTTSNTLGSWGRLDGSILQGFIATDSSETTLGRVAGYSGPNSNLLSSELAGYEILPNAQNDNLPGYVYGTQVVKLDMNLTNDVTETHRVNAFGNIQNSFVTWFGSYGTIAGPRAQYIHTDTQDYTLDREIIPGGRYWASMFVSVPPTTVIDPEWTKRGIGFEVSTVSTIDGIKDYQNVNSSTIAKIMVPIAHSSVTINAGFSDFTVQRSLVTSAIQSVRAIYTTAVLVRTSSATTTFGNWWRVAMLFQAHSSLTSKTDALHVRLQTDSYANNVLTSSISTGKFSPPIYVAGLQIAPAKTSQTWPPDYLSTVVPDAPYLAEPEYLQNTQVRYSFNSAAVAGNQFMRFAESVGSLVRVFEDDSEWRLDARDQRSGRYVFTGGTTNQGRFMYFLPLANVTASTVQVTFVAGDTWSIGSIIKTTVDNNLDPPESGDNLLLQYSTNGTSWVTHTTLWNGANWGASGATNAPRTTSVTYTTSSPVTLLYWRLAQTTHGSGASDEYAILGFETVNNLGTEASYGRFIDLQLRDYVQFVDRTTVYADFAPVSVYATQHAQAYQPGIFDTFSRRVTSALTPTGPGLMNDAPLMLDDPITSAYYYRTLPEFDQSSSETIILDQIFFANLLFRSADDFPGDLDPFGNINTLESRGELRMTDYVADIDYLQSDYVGETRSIS